MKDKDIKIVGDWNWIETKNILILGLMNCNTEEDFKKIVVGISTSMGSLKDIQRTRKRLGIKPLTKEEIERLKK